MNQKQQIWEHIKNGGSLTVNSAIRKFGCYALSQRIGELVKDGKPIDRDGWYSPRKGTKVKLYRLAHPQMVLPV